VRCSSNMKPRFRAEWVVVSEELLILASCLLSVTTAKPSVDAGLREIRKKCLRQTTRLQLCYTAPHVAGISAYV